MIKVMPVQSGFDMEKWEPEQERNNKAASIRHGDSSCHIGLQIHVKHNLGTPRNNRKLYFKRINSRQTIL